MIPSKESSFFAVALLALALPATAAGLASKPAEKAADEELPPVEKVISQALARAAWAKEQGVPERYRFFQDTVVERLADDGSVKSGERLRHEVYAIADVWHEKLVARDGKPISAREAERERKKEQELRERLARGKKPNGDEESERVEFNRELIDRFQMKLERREAVNDRPAYLVSFVPKSGDLLVRKRMDHALNKSSGRIWIDEQTYEIAAVEFELNEPVRLWWGILGSIRALDGRVERQPLDDGFWVSTRAKFYMDGRVMFTSLHQRREMAWTDHEPRQAEVARAPTAGAQK